MSKRVSRALTRAADNANYRGGASEAERIAEKLLGRDKPVKKFGEIEAERNQRARARITLRKF